MTSEGMYIITFVLLKASTDDFYTVINSGCGPSGKLRLHFSGYIYETATVLVNYNSTMVE